MSHSVRLLGIGTAVPDGRFTQQAAASHAADIATAGDRGPSPASSRGIAALYRRSGVRTRGTVIPEAA